MIRILTFLLGFGFMVIGLTYVITYLNLLSMGYSFNNYLNFICRRGECLIALLGLIIVSIVIFTKGEHNDLYI